MDWVGNKIIFIHSGSTTLAYPASLSEFANNEDALT